VPLRYKNLEAIVTNQNTNKEIIMGRGDGRSKKGKITKKSNGNSRPTKSNKKKAAKKE
jgi:ribosomal small subunit protein bTHX